MIQDCTDLGAAYCEEWTYTRDSDWFTASTSVDVMGNWASGILLYQGLFMFFVLFSILIFYFKNR